MFSVTNFLKQHSLSAGILLMFLLTWPIDLASSGLLPIQLPFAVIILVGWGFVIASVMMTGLTLGKGAVLDLLKRFLIWRVGWSWFLAAFLLLPSLKIASVLLTAAVNHAGVDFSTAMAYKLFSPSTSLYLLAAPWFLYEIFTNGEEIGWRGYVLPRLQAKHNALVSSLIVGLLWGFWHLPKFLGSGPWNGRSFPWSIAGTVALAVLYTWLYNNTRGSLLLVTIFHASGNTIGMFLPESFAAPGGITSNFLIVLYIFTAIVVTVIAGPARLSRRRSTPIAEPENNRSGLRIDVQTFEL